MTLFFPNSTSDVKINASNSQVNVTVGEAMTITAGDTFTITGGSTSSIKIGPATSFLLGSAVNISLASTLSYTYGFTAAYGMSDTATNVTSVQSATDSYHIQAGTYTPVQQAIVLGQDKQIFYVLLATIVSMGAIALAVVAGLSSPVFIKDPNNPNNTNAVSNNSSDMARAACAMAITTVSVFMAQWGLTYLLAKSSKFSPVTNLLLDSTGITANVQTVAANTANLLMYDNALIVPSVETIMFAPQEGDNPNLIHRVNQAPVMGKSPQLSEIILTTSQINLNSTSLPSGVKTHNTQIIMDSAKQTISLQSDSAANINGGSINIGADTLINNPNGSITLFSQAGTALGNALLEIKSATKASLSCSDGTSSGVGAILATPTEVNIGMSATGGNATFNSTGVTISGTNINLGGVITIFGSPTPNANLNAIITDVADNKAIQEQLAAELALVQTELTALKEIIQTSKLAAEAQTEMLMEAAQLNGMSKTGP